MGVPKFDSMPPSGAQSPIEEPANGGHITDLDFWDCCTDSDVTKHLVSFREEVESVYPFIDIGEYIALSKEILQAIQGKGLPEGSSLLCSNDIALARVAVAIGILLEDPSRIELSISLVGSVETTVSSILSPQVDLKEVQLLTMLVSHNAQTTKLRLTSQSIFYFHAGEDLLAWRTIGIAAREALEMGLHRKRSLLDNFKDSDSRRLATRVFWCVYVLDRRWSFGTSLSFALVDKDVDPELPKPVSISRKVNGSTDFIRTRNICISSVWSATVNCAPRYGRLYHLLDLHLRVYPMTPQRHWISKRRIGWNPFPPISDFVIHV